jgi:hypothetical protein
LLILLSVLRGCLEGAGGIFGAGCWGDIWREMHVGRLFCPWPYFPKYINGTDKLVNKCPISCTDLTLRRTAVLYLTKTLYFVHTVDFHALLRLPLGVWLPSSRGGDWGSIPGQYVSVL